MASIDFVDELNSLLLPVTDSSCGDLGQFLDPRSELPSAEDRLSAFGCLCDHAWGTRR